AHLYGAGRAPLLPAGAALAGAGGHLRAAVVGWRGGAAAQGRVARLLEWLQEGRELAAAGCLAGVFTPLEGSLVRAAQSAGSPAGMFERLAERHARRAEQGAALRARLLLPGGVLLLALLIQPLPALVGGSLGAGAYLWGVLQPFQHAGPPPWRRGAEAQAFQRLQQWHTGTLQCCQLGKQLGALGE
ncbi:MAG: type II secretion system F family protein, partial [Pseudomonadaceae bacterium]|nr:type II secretion system F family protein [Pseudomonadaceae bacterium]